MVINLIFNIFELPYIGVMSDGQREAVTRWQFFFNCTILTANIMKEEIWKDIPGYEGLYQASTLGRIKSLDRTARIVIRGMQSCRTVNERILIHGISTHGYYIVGLSMKGKTKTFTVHKLVALTFIPKINPLLQINHINSDRTDNRLDNIEWVTCSENIKHSYRSGYRYVKPPMKGIKGKNNPKSKAVIQYSLDGIIINEFECIISAQETTGINHIGKVCNNKAITAGGFKWKFKKDCL